jgi:hypothetical protein
MEKLLSPKEAANDLLRSLQGSTLDLYGPRAESTPERGASALIIDEAL